MAPDASLWYWKANDRGIAMPGLGNVLFWASVLIAGAWIYFNYSTGGAFYSLGNASPQAGIMVLIGIALRLLAAGGKKA
jgi:hypothetical protein